MATDKMVQLLGALKAGTDNRQIIWQDLPEEEMFRAHIVGGMVRIGKSESGVNGYKLWLMVPGGAIAWEIGINAGEPYFDLIEDIYMSARLAARGGDALIDRILQLFPPVNA
jgi:hypothetical protein